MQDAPDTADLLRLAHDALAEHVLPDLSGPARYQALMALRALAIATRQIETGPARRAEALDRLRAVAPAATLSAANAALARRIRAGETSEDLHAALLAVAGLAVSESDPKSPAPRRAPQTDPPDS
jgi:hypothetical protein